MEGLSARKTSVARAGSARILGRRFISVPILVAALVGLAALATGGSVLAAASTDASVNNYQQCANDKPGSATDPTDCVPQGWINGILNAQNSQYSEDQVTPQRLGLDIPSGGPTTGRTITIRYLARKGQGGAGNHAYDSLATWNYTQTNADRCQDLAAADCPGGAASTFLIPSDTTVVADSNGPGSSTALHELPDANRMMTMYGGTITNVSAPVHDNAAGPGDDYATVVVTYSVSTATDTKVQLLFGGHLAASTGPRGWGANVGSSFINGGPYHIRIDQLDDSSIGNRDNQINSAAILPIGTQTQTALHETDSSGADVNPPNNQDPAAETGITVTLPVGGSGTYVTDYATVAPAGSTGTVAFRYYASLAACQADTNFNGGTSAGSGKTLDANSVAKSNPVHITNVGVIYWRAVFTGTGVSASSDSGCNSEILTAIQATTLTTNAGGPYVLGADGTVALHDVAHLAGGTSDAGGHITFMLFSDNACTTQVGGDVTVAVNGADGQDYTSPSITVSAHGTYYWVANYSGDGNNAASSTVCGDANESPLVLKPHISISKSPDAQTVLIGQTATFTITVTNDGEVTLTSVVVTDALAPGCARTQADVPALASMAPGATVTYTCTLANVTSGFTNVAVATGHAGSTTVTAQDTAVVTAVAPATHPAITIVKNPKSQTVTSGGTATFTITVTNTGDVALTNVTVSDALSPNCNRTIGTLNPGQSTSYTCTRANVTASFNNVAVATGHAGATTVTAQDTAPVTAKAAPLKPKKVTKVTPKVVSHKKPKATG